MKISTGLQHETFFKEKINVVNLKQ